MNMILASWGLFFGFLILVRLWRLRALGFFFFDWATDWALKWHGLGGAQRRGSGPRIKNPFIKRVGSEFGGKPAS